MPMLLWCITSSRYYPWLAAWHFRNYENQGVVPTAVMPIVALDLAGSALPDYIYLVGLGFSKRGAMRQGELRRASAGARIPPEHIGNLLHPGQRPPFRWEVTEFYIYHEFRNPFGYRVPGVVMLPEPTTVPRERGNEWDLMEQRTSSGEELPIHLERTVWRQCRPRSS